MLNKRIMALFVGIFLNVNTLKPVEIDKSHIFIPESLGQVRVFHNNNTFSILKDDKTFQVQNCFVDKEIRNLSNEKLGYFLGTIKDIEINGQKITLTKISDEQSTDMITDLSNPTVIQLNEEESLRIKNELSSGAYLAIEQLSDGQYAIHSKQRLPGGGIWGAIGGAWAGKFLASVVVHTAIFVASAAVSIVATPAAGAILFGSLETTLAAPIEAFTTAAAVAGGIAGAVATGPI